MARGLLDLADETLSLIGQHIAAQNKDLAIKLARGEVNEREVHRFPNHIIPFRSTCRRIRQLIPLAQLGVVIKALSNSVLHPCDHVQLVLDTIPPQCSSAIRFVKLEDQNDDNEMCMGSVYVKILARFPDLKYLSIDTLVEGCLHGPHNTYIIDHLELRSLSCTGGFHGCLRHFCASLLRQATSIYHIRIAPDCTMRTLAGDFDRVIKSTFEYGALSELESLSLPHQLVDEDAHPDPGFGLLPMIAEKCASFKEFNFTDYSPLPNHHEVHFSYLDGKMNSPQMFDGSAPDGLLVLRTRKALIDLSKPDKLQRLGNIFDTSLDLAAWVESAREAGQVPDWLLMPGAETFRRMEPLHVDAMQQVVTGLRTLYPSLFGGEMRIVADIGSHQITSWWEWCRASAADGSSIDVVPHPLGSSVDRYKTIVKSSARTNGVQHVEETTDEDDEEAGEGEDDEEEEEEDENESIDESEEEVDDEGSEEDEGGSDAKGNAEEAPDTDSNDSHLGLDCTDNNVDSEADRAGEAGETPSSPEVTEA